MSNDTKHVTPFLMRLQTMYGEPDSDNPAAFLAEYARLLKKYSGSTLDKACDLVLRNNRYKTWPTIGECVSCCEDAIEKTTADAPRNFGMKQPEWSPERVKAADEMIVSDIGRRAGDEGWILALWDFCREQQRLPRAHEVGSLVAKSRGFDDAYGKCCDGTVTILAADLKAWGDSILQRRNEKAEIAWGVVPALTDRSRAMQGETQ